MRWTREICQVGEGLHPSSPPRRDEGESGQNIL